MISIIGTWDLAWNTPIAEVELWRFALEEYGVDAWYMAPVSGIAAGVPWLTEDAQLETRLLAERAAGRTLVFVDESATGELADFVHPADACYVLGKTGFSPYVSFHDAQQGDLAVRIATVANRGGFWPHQAAALVLHDRLAKG